MIVPGSCPRVTVIQSAGVRLLFPTVGVSLGVDPAQLILARLSYASVVS